MLTFVRQEPRRTFSGALVKLGSRMGSTTFGSMGSLALWTSVNVAPFSSNIDDSLRSETVEILGTCPKAYRPTKRRINSLWPMGKVLYSRHHMIGIEYRICCGLAGLAFMCNNPFLFVFLFPWGQG